MSSLLGVCWREEPPNELLAGERRTGDPKDGDIGLDTEPDEPDVEDVLPKELRAGERRTGDPKDVDIGLDTEPNEPDVEDELPNELLAGESTLMSRRMTISSSTQSWMNKTSMVSCQTSF